MEKEVEKKKRIKMPTVEDLRPLYCQLGYSTKSDGSAQLSQGKTTVLAGVYGPVEVKRNREKPDRMDVEITLQPRVGQSSVDNRTREAMIREITEACVKLVLHPRAGVNLSIHVLEQDEGTVFNLMNFRGFKTCRDLWLLFKKCISFLRKPFILLYAFKTKRIVSNQRM